MGGITLQSVGIYFAALIVLFVLGWLLAMPRRTLLRFLIHAVSGGVLLWVAWLASPITGIAPSINPATVGASIFLGVPGALLAVGATVFLQSRK